jgi:ketosteroid isomerase-like protein
MAFGTPQAAYAQSDSARVVGVIGAFHAALAAGDSSTALAILSDDVAILETGGVESKTQYRTGHINGDMSFARAVPSVRTVTGVHVRGDAAWVTSSSVTQGESNGRQINSAGAELVVLSKETGTWKIRAIHWSSRARRAP